MESHYTDQHPFNIIAAVATDDEGHWGIGKDGTLPWRKTDYGKCDMEFFKETTTGGIVICGRKTYESIGKPLSHRLTIVVTTLGDLIPEEYINNGSVVVARNFDEALCTATKLREGRTIWVIGGSIIYSIAVNHPMLEYMYITRIPGKYDCNEHFPHTEKALTLTIHYKDF